MRPPSRCRPDGSGEGSQHSLLREKAQKTIYGVWPFKKDGWREMYTRMLTCGKEVKDGQPETEEAGRSGAWVGTMEPEEAPRTPLRGTFSCSHENVSPAPRLPITAM